MGRKRKTPSSNNAIDLDTLNNLGFKTLRIMTQDNMLNDIYGPTLNELESLTTLNKAHASGVVA